MEHFSTSSATETKTLCDFAIQLVDHTSLNENDTEEVIDALIQSANKSNPHPACVCVYPRFTKYIKTKFPLTRVAVVVNFPLGKSSQEDVIRETATAVADGADEIDMVIDYNHLMRNQHTGVLAARQLVHAVRSICPEGRVLLKVIIESGQLQTEELITAASLAAIEGGADFIKTSTGKVPINATIPASTIMLRVIKNWMETHPNSKRLIGFKAAGGVKTIDQVKEYLNLAESIMGQGWVCPNTFRFGASSLLSILRTAHHQSGVQFNQPDLSLTTTMTPAGGY